jgi:hypothetical protein
MNTNKFIQKFIKLEKAISSERGHFLLFALFLPEEGHGEWDILAAASWISDDKGEAMKYLAEKVRYALTPKELVHAISRIVLIDEDNPGLEEIHETIRVEHGLLEIKNEVFFGLEIKHACFITSRRQSIQEEEDAEMAMEA